MKNSFLKRLLVLFTIISTIFPSVLLAQLEIKNFELESVNWQIVKSDCDSWYDYQVNQEFNVNGWTAVSSLTRIYGYSANNKSCSGVLEIKNDNPGVYALYTYNLEKKSWSKLASSNQNFSLRTSNKAITLVLAKANISKDKKSFADFTIKNNVFTETANTFTPTTTQEMVASFDIGPSNGTSTISWINPLDNLYQLLLLDKEKLTTIPFKIDNRKKIASSEIVQNKATSTIIVIKNKPKDIGLATWYAYKKCDCAASRDYPKGTKLKVTNLFPGSNYGKSVIVKVNDYGPMEYTGNLIDLDKVAFQKIANLGSGVVPVSVEVVK